VFRGQYEHAIDGKGRTSVPSRFREVLSSEETSKLVVTTGLDPCLVAYPMAEWEAFEARLAKLPKRKEIVAYCRGPYCVLAVEAVRRLRASGRRARRLEDGVREWTARGLPVEGAQVSA